MDIKVIILVFFSIVTSLVAQVEWESSMDVTMTEKPQGFKEMIHVTTADLPNPRPLKQYNSGETHQLRGFITTELKAYLKFLADGSENNEKWTDNIKINVLPKSTRGRNIRTDKERKFKESNFLLELVKNEGSILEINYKAGKGANLKKPPVVTATDSGILVDENGKFCAKLGCNINIKIIPDLGLYSGKINARTAFHNHPIVDHVLRSLKNKQKNNGIAVNSVITSFEPDISYYKDRYRFSIREIGFAVESSDKFNIKEQNGKYFYNTTDDAVWKSFPQELPKIFHIELEGIKGYLAGQSATMRIIHPKGKPDKPLDPDGDTDPDSNPEDEDEDEYPDPFPYDEDRSDIKGIVDLDIDSNNNNDLELDDLEDLLEEMPSELGKLVLATDEHKYTLPGYAQNINYANDDRYHLKEGSQARLVEVVIDLTKHPHFKRSGFIQTSEVALSFNGSDPFDILSNREADNIKHDSVSDYLYKLSKDEDKYSKSGTMRLWTKRENRTAIEIKKVRLYAQNVPADEIKNRGFYIKSGVPMKWTHLCKLCGVSPKGGVVTIYLEGTRSINKQEKIVLNHRALAAAVEGIKYTHAEDSIQAHVVSVDLDTDSGNFQGRIFKTPNPHQDKIEMIKELAKIVLIDKRLNAEGKASWAAGIDGNSILTGDFDNWLFDFKVPQNKVEDYHVSFRYSGSDPDQDWVREGKFFRDKANAPMTGYDPVLVRLWSKNMSEARSSKSIVDGGDYITPEAKIPLDKLMDSDGNVILYMEGLIGHFKVSKVVATVYYKGRPICDIKKQDECCYTMLNLVFDLDIDSNNNGFIDATKEEDEIETELPGKLILANHETINTVPGYARGIKTDVKDPYAVENAEDLKRLTPLRITVPQSAKAYKLNDYAIVFNYHAEEQLGFSISAKGLKGEVANTTSKYDYELNGLKPLRLWLPYRGMYKNILIKNNTELKLNDLDIVDGQITVYLEAINHTLNNRLINCQLTVRGYPLVEDSVAVTALALDLAVDSDNDGITQASLLEDSIEKKEGYEGMKVTVYNNYKDDQNHRFPAWAEGIQFRKKNKEGPQVLEATYGKFQELVLKMSKYGLDDSKIFIKLKYSEDDPRACARELGVVDTVTWQDETKPFLDQRLKEFNHLGKLRLWTIPRHVEAESGAYLYLTRDPESFLESETGQFVPNNKFIPWSKFKDTERILHHSQDESRKYLYIEGSDMGDDPKTDIKVEVYYLKDTGSSEEGEAISADEADSSTEVVVDEKDLIFIGVADRVNLTLREQKGVYEKDKPDYFKGHQKWAEISYFPHQQLIDDYDKFLGKAAFERKVDETTYDGNFDNFKLGEVWKYKHIEMRHPHFPDAETGYGFWRVTRSDGRCYFASDLWQWLEVSLGDFNDISEDQLMLMRGMLDIENLFTDSIKEARTQYPAVEKDDYSEEDLIYDLFYNKLLNAFSTPNSDKGKQMAGNLCLEYRTRGGVFVYAQKDGKYWMPGGEPLIRSRSVTTQLKWGIKIYRTEFDAVKLGELGYNIKFWTPLAMEILWNCNAVTRVAGGVMKIGGKVIRNLKEAPRYFGGKVKKLRPTKTNESLVGVANRNFPTLSSVMKGRQLFSNWKKSSDVIGKSGDSVRIKNVPDGPNLKVNIKTRADSDEFVVVSVKCNQKNVGLLKKFKSLVKRAGSNGCFKKGTRINTLDGFVNIEDVKVGDFVYSKSEFSEETAYKRVTAVHTNCASVLTRITYSLRGPPYIMQVVTGTFSHPVWSNTYGSWLSLGKLKEGDIIQTANGDAEVVKVDFIQSPAGEKFTTYNLSVEDFGTYYVGRLGLWVHNDAKCDEILDAYKTKLSKGTHPITAHNQVIKELKLSPEQIIIVRKQACLQLCQKALPAGSKIRTTVPYVKADGFNKWWDSLSKRDLKFLLESKCQFGTKTPKEIMGARIRHPGGYHEHFMVSRQLVFKGWKTKIKMKQIKEWRTKVKQVKFKDGNIHGNNSTSNAFHRELGDMTDKCKSLNEFKKGINALAKEWFPNGKLDLPKDLRN